MYLESLDAFISRAEELYRANPLRTRYVVKYRHCDGKMVLKVTDDATCLKYKTDQQADLKKIERLNNLFFSLMATGASAPPAEAERPPEPAAAKGPARQRKG